MAPATVNNHLAQLSALFSWITVQVTPGQFVIDPRP
jgi:hypothetical protein